MEIQKGTAGKLWALRFKYYPNGIKITKIFETEAEMELFENQLKAKENERLKKRAELETWKRNF